LLAEAHQLCTDIFKQIDTLLVKVGSEHISLFDETPNGVMVTIDDRMLHDITLACMKCCEAKDQIMIAKGKAVEKAKNYTLGK
jgi:hypothetical protein